MAKKLKVTKITMTTKDGKEVELSLDEAKDLHGQLEELFGEKTTYLPSQPRWIYPERPYWQPYGPVWVADKMTCSCGTSGLMTTYSGDSE